MANWQKKPGMNGLAEQLNSEPASMPFQSAAYDQPAQAAAPGMASQKAVGAQDPSGQRAPGEQPAARARGMQGLSSQLGQPVGTLSASMPIAENSNVGPGANVAGANDYYTAAGGEANKRPTKEQWSGPIHTGPTGFVNYSDFRGANAGDIGVAATNYRNQLGSLQQKAREAALRYEKTQDPKDRAAWLDATDAADRYEKTNQGGTALDRSLGLFTGQYDKANKSWDAEREDLGVDVTNEEMRVTRAKEEAARAEKQKLADAAAAGDAAAKAQIERQAKADKLGALQGKWREMTPAARDAVAKDAAQKALAAGGGAWQGSMADAGNAMYSSFDAAAQAGRAWDEDKKRLEDEINRLKQELA